MKNFWTGFLIAAVVAVLAVYLGRLTSPGTGIKGKPTAAFLIHVYETNGSCAAALVAPKRGDAVEGGEVIWDRRIDCTSMRIESVDITNFRQKSGACESDHSSGDPEKWPVEQITDGPNGSKKTTVKAGAAHGQSRLPYCYDVTVKVTGNAGPTSITADPEMDIVR